MADDLTGDPMGLAEYAAAAQQAPIHEQLQAVGIPTTPSQPQQPDIAQTGSTGPDGSYVPPAAVPTPQQAQSANPLGAVANAIVPAAMAGGDNPDGTPKQVPQAAPQQAAPASPTQAPSEDSTDDWGGLFKNQPQQAPQKQSDNWDLYAPAGPAKAVAELPATPSTGVDGAAANSVNGNNFGNIRPTGGTGFNSYATPVDGVAAMSQNLSAYATQHGINTLNGLTARWAPKGDGANDPVAYAQSLSKATGIPVDQPINLADPTIQQKLIPAMAQVEQGKAGLIDPQTLTQGIQLASSGKPIQMGQPLQSTAPGSAAAPTVATNWTPGSAEAAQRLAAAQALPGSGANSVADELRAVGLNPNTMMGNPLLALGAGLAGKRTFGEGISAAASNLNQLYQQRGDLGFKLAQMGLENKRLDQQMGYQNALLGVRDTQLGQGQQKIDQQVKNQDLQRQQRQQQIDYTTSGGAQSFKDNLQESREIEEEGKAAANQLGTYKNWQTLAQSGQAGVGPGVMQEMKRRIATAFPELGVGPSTSDMQVAQIMGRLWQQDAVRAMRGTGLRTQNEFKVFQEAAPGMSTDPNAAAAAAGAMVNSANADLAAYNAWQDPNTNQAEIMHQTNGVRNFRARFDQPALNATAKGTVAVTPNGPAQQNIIRYDAQGNRVSS